MRLAVAVALVVNLGLVVAFGLALAGNVLVCSGTDCGTWALVLAIGGVAVALGLVLWRYGDPRPLLVIDLVILAAGWVVEASGAIRLGELSWALVPFGTSIWLSCGVFALGTLWLERSSPTGPAPIPVPSPGGDRLGGGPPAAEGSRRFATLMEALDRLPPDGVRLLAVTPLDPAEHDAARGRALARAEEAGRTWDVADAREVIGTWVRRWLGDGAYDPTFLAVAWRHEPLRPEDRLRLIQTLDDAALGLVVSDLVDETTADELIGPAAALLEGTTR